MMISGQIESWIAIVDLKECGIMDLPLLYMKSLNEGMDIGFRNR